MHGIQSDIYAKNKLIRCNWVEMPSRSDEAVQWRLAKSIGARQKTEFFTASRMMRIIYSWQNEILCNLSRLNQMYRLEEE